GGDFGVKEATEAATTGQAARRVALLSGRVLWTLAVRAMPGLMACRTEFGPSTPFKGFHVNRSLHMTRQTGVLIETLAALGAKVRGCSCSIFSTQRHATAAFAKAGTSAVFAGIGETLPEYWWCAEQVMTVPGQGGRDRLVDDGGEATLLIHKGKEFERKALKCRGVSKETITGWRRRREMAAKDELLSRTDFFPLTPFKSLHVKASLHMTIQTGVLIETLAALGAKVRGCSCSIFSTQRHATAAFAKAGTSAVFAGIGVALNLSASQLAPQELSIIAWAFGMLGVNNPTLFHALVVRAVPQLESFAMGGLLKLAWGSAASGVDVELFMTIQNEVIARLEQVDLRSCSELSRNALLQDTLGLLWASNFAGCCSRNLLTSARLVIRQAGAIMDRAHGPSSSPACESLGGLRSSEADLWQPASTPQTILDLPDRVVIFKHPGWEVHSQHTELRLSSILQATLGKRFAIMHDEEHQCGFLHRLDVPSSGLVLVDKTYEAYYDLNVQLNAGEIARDYVILCHGWVRPCLKDIKAKVYWRGLLPASAGDQGKPSLTRLKVTAHARHSSTVLSLVVVRITTGRRHQIRSHFSHLGHPTVCDGKYTAEATFRSGQDICTRNVLHRYRPRLP
ncbi:unnamed protein product, partial [Polarella glacialis]